MSLSAWREVAADQIGLGEREYVRCPGGIVWRLDAHLGGGATTAATVEESASTVLPLMRVGQFSKTPFDLVTDMRRAVVGPDNASVLAAAHSFMDLMIATFGATTRRQAFLLARDWTTPYWKSLNISKGVPWQTEVFFDSPPMWAWLDVDPVVGAEIDAFVETASSAPDIVAAIATALRREPTLGLADAARSVGCSVRSLQRVLAASGKNFATLRNEIRLEHALALLARDLKLGVIATTIGFASTSHFTIWFRRLRGLSPSQFRDAL